MYETSIFTGPSVLPFIERTGTDPGKVIAPMTVALLCIVISSLSVDVAAHATEGENAVRSTAGSVVLLKDIMDHPEKHDSFVDTAADDAVLDLETGHVVFLIASVTDATSVDPRWRFLPFHRTSPGLRNSIEPQTIPSKLTREFAAKHFGQLQFEPYWSQYRKDLSEAARESFDEVNFELQKFSTIEKVRLVSEEGMSIGTITDLGVDSNTREILYCVVSTMNGGNAQRRAIPLGAFVRDANHRQWRIDLPRESILQFEPMQAGVVPTKIDRGWAEYVAVRYGRNGVQAQESD